jgi:hypothetical protein
MSDEDYSVGDPQIDAYFTELRKEATRDGSERRLEAVRAFAHAVRSLPPKPDWLTAESIRTFFDGELEPHPTMGYAPADELVEALVIEEAPSGVDPQANVEYLNGVLTVELEVAPEVPELWGTASIDEGLIAAPFERSPGDSRIRVARLPIGPMRPLRIGIAIN